VLISVVRVAALTGAESSKVSPRCLPYPFTSNLKVGRLHNTGGNNPVSKKGRYFFDRARI
jgi:hypothetical protein